MHPIYKECEACRFCKIWKMVSIIRAKHYFKPMKWNHRGEPLSRRPSSFSIHVLQISLQLYHFLLQLDHL